MTASPAQFHAFRRAISASRSLLSRARVAPARPCRHSGVNGYVEMNVAGRPGDHPAVAQLSDVGANPAGACAEPAARRPHPVRDRADAGRRGGCGRDRPGRRDRGASTHGTRPSQTASRPIAHIVSGSAGAEVRQPLRCSGRWEPFRREPVLDAQQRAWGCAPRPGLSEGRGRQWRASGLAATSMLSGLEVVWGT